MAACQAAGIKFIYRATAVDKTQTGYYPYFGGVRAWDLLGRLARLLGFPDKEAYLERLPRERAAIFKRAKAGWRKK